MKTMDLPLMRPVVFIGRYFFDSWAGMETPHKYKSRKFDWVRSLPFIGVHLTCFAVFWVGWSWAAVAAAAAFYFVRMFAITGIYHRYFSHRTYRTSRFMQFVFAVLGLTAVQRGPLWWAAHHRHHHVYSDRPEDLHSPLQNGFLWSHVGWFLVKANFLTNLKAVPDLAKFPELRLLDRFDIVVGVLTGAAVFLFGVLLENAAPGLGTNGWQMLVWGFFISTVVLYHGTFMINSVAHKIGRKRFETGDTSGNSLLLSLVTLGEGWHNNHHHFPAATRQGFYWYEIDITYYTLKVLSWLGLVWNLRPVPEHILHSRRVDRRTV